MVDTAPTPDEIHARAAAIRASWTEAERRARWRGRSEYHYDAQGVEQAARRAMEERLQAERQEGRSDPETLLGRASGLHLSSTTKSLPMAPPEH